MELTKQAISEYKNVIEGLDGYNLIVSKIEKNLTIHPDISIESCKSLIEGLCKKALELLSEDYNSKKNIRTECDNKFPKLIKTAFNHVYKNKFEAEIHESLSKLINIKSKLDKFINVNSNQILENLNEAITKISVIRDNRGDISHGRIYPKIKESEITLAKSIMSITDGICSYMIHEFGQQYLVEKNVLVKKEFENMTDFNNWLDERVVLPITKVNLSKYLYDNDYAEYESVYELDYQEYLKIEGEFEYEEDINQDFEEQKVIVEEPKVSIVENPLVKEKIKQIVLDGIEKVSKMNFNAESRIGELLKGFAVKWKLDHDDLEELYNDFYFSEKPPLRDEIVKIMINKPENLKERIEIVPIIITEFLELAERLNILRIK